MIFGYIPEMCYKLLKKCQYYCLYSYNFVAEIKI
jgi:hypothetical protein